MKEVKWTETAIKILQDTSDFILELGVLVLKKNSLSNLTTEFHNSKIIHSWGQLLRTHKSED